ncbi:MAG: Rid family hydrolase [Rhodothalassiaceae bacterium]
MRTLIRLSVICLLTTSVAQADGARQRAQVIVPDDARQTYETYGYAPAIKTEDGTIYVSGVIVGLTGEGSYEARYAAGFRQALEHIGSVLAEAGASLDDVVDITTYHTDLARQIGAAVQTRMEMMAKPHPSWTAVGTTGLAVPEGVTEIRVIAKAPPPKP